MRMQMLLDELHFAVLSIARHPAFTGAVVLTMALGIGVNAAMFGVVDRLLLSPPAHVEDHEEIRRIYRRYDLGGELRTSATLTWPDYVDLQTVPSFRSVAATAYPRELTLEEGGRTRRVQVRQVSHSLFPLLGVQPHLGRFFGAEEDEIGARPTAVLSWEHWQRAYGGDPDVLGRAVELSGTEFTVIGVAPRGFTGANLEGMDFWLPIATAQHALTGGDGWKESRFWYWLRPIVRMTEGASLNVAEERATALYRNARSDEEDDSIVTGPPNPGWRNGSVVSP